jgi:hypothetical protein
MKSSTPCIVSAILFAFLGVGCATVFNGYFDKVTLTNVPDDLQITTSLGVPVPLERDSVRVKSGNGSNRYQSQVRTRITLRCSSEQVLVLQSKGQKRLVQIHGKLGGHWFILDTACLVLPLVYDAITGCWYYFDPIDTGFPEQAAP